MSRSAAVGVALLFAALVLAAIPGAEATHEWGHRYMIFGRILDSEGNPAQQIDVRISVETTDPQDPWMIVTTDCSGLYYSLESTGNPARGGGLEAGRMHIHNSALPSNSKYHVSTEWGETSGDVRNMLKFSNVNLQLDAPTEPAAGCSQVDTGAWQRGYIVVGHMQKDFGDRRADIMTIAQLNQYENVTVSIETANGTKTEDVQVGEFGDYFAFFENVTVTGGGRVTTQYKDEVREGKIETKFRVSEVNVVIEAGGSGKALLIVAAVGGGIVVVGAGAYGASALRDKMATKKAIEGSTRKRANR